MRCWYRPGCNLAANNCEKTCHRFLEVAHLIDHCGMPNADNYIKSIVPEKEDVNAFLRLKEIKDNVVQFTEEGRNLYIYSEKFGNGKTTWALKILYKYFDEIWCGNGFRTRGYFIYVPELLNRLTYSYRSSEDYKDFCKMIDEVDLVIWDDIAATNLTANDINHLSTFIDSRALKCKSNIYTGNLANEELRKAIGNRLYNRLWDSSEVITLVGRGRRI